MVDNDTKLIINLFWKDELLVIHSNTKKKHLVTDYSVAQMPTTQLARWSLRSPCTLHSLLSLTHMSTLTGSPQPHPGGTTSLYPGEGRGVEHKGCSVRAQLHTALEAVTLPHPQAEDSPAGPPGGDGT